MNPHIQVGRTFEHRTDRYRLVKVTEVDMSEERPWVTVQVLDGRDRPENYGKTSSSMYLDVFEERYQYVPEMPDNADAELADAARMLQAAKDLVESHIEHMGSDVVDLLIRVARHECATRIYQGVIRSPEAARLIDAEITEDERTKLLRNEGESA